MLGNNEDAVNVAWPFTNGAEPSVTGVLLSGTLVPEV